jgi:hypothetical protein
MAEMPTPAAPVAELPALDHAVLVVPAATLDAVPPMRVYSRYMSSSGVDART